jgi:predicted HD superfamily hydrolase involved in NAD metabolism
MPVDYTKDHDQLLKLLKKYLRGEKFIHSLGVEQTAIKLAKLHGADWKKAGLAGMLHDITKQMDNTALARQYGISSVSEKTLHGPVAACWLYENGIVGDEEVLSAIKYHTTGRADMTLLEKVIYLADFIEPSRDFEGVDGLRELVYADIEKGLLKGLEMSLYEVLRKKTAIDADSVAAYNCYRMMEAGKAGTNGPEEE